MGCLGSSEFAAVRDGGFRRSELGPQGVTQPPNRDRPALACAEARRTLLHRITGAGQGVARDEPCAPKERHFEAKPPVRRSDKHPTLREESPRPRCLEGEQGAQLRAVLAAQQTLGVHCEAGQVLGGEVDPAATRVAGDVLPVVHELESGADLIGGVKSLGIPHPEELQHEATYGIRRIAAVLQELLKGLIALLHSVAAERAEERMERIEGEPELADHRTTGALGVVGRRPAFCGGSETALPLRERVPRLDAGRRLVDQIVCDA